jgi:protein SCO1/2
MNLENGSQRPEQQMATAKGCLEALAQGLLLSAFRLPPSAFRLSPSAFCFPPSAICFLLAAFCLLPSAFCFPVRAQMVPKSNSPLYSPLPPLDTGTSNGLPNALKDVGIDQRLDQQVPLDIQLRDESGQTVRLGNYFHGKPVVLSLVYYDCPMLCTQVLSGMIGAFGQLSFTAGREFEVVTVSFDPREGPALAAKKKEVYLSGYNRPGVDDGWHFLTADPPSIKRLTESVGFKYRFDVSTNQFAHASGIMVLTPQGKLARYFYGIDYPAKDLRLGLVEASEGKIGSPVDKLLLYCYHYDPATGRYGPVVMNMVRISGVVTVVGITLLLLLLRRRSKGPGTRDLKVGEAV